MAESPQRTLRIPLRAVEPALICHAEVAKREVVLHGIVRVERAKRCCDIGGHLPARARIARQSQASPHADNVRVERDDELGGGHVLQMPKSTARSAPSIAETDSVACTRHHRTGREKNTQHRVSACGCRTQDANRLHRARVEMIRVRPIDPALQIVASRKKASIDPFCSMRCRYHEGG